MRKVSPKTREQRCWVHKTANVLNKLPKGVQPKAEGMLHDIWSVIGLLCHSRPQLDNAGFWYAQRLCHAWSGRSLVTAVQTGGY